MTSCSGHPDDPFVKGESYKKFLAIYPLFLIKGKVLSTAQFE